ncbi:hypothetical protein ABIB57_001902 [Devosia sp. UYZn731]|uniref:hypothetical protein n=1 Tax=Devosia sp. UYZn731 TaxID=3156345 RepID=UPI0033907C42
MTALARQTQTALPTASDLRALVPGIVEPRERIETTFVAVGDRLTKGAAMLNRITRIFEALPQSLESPELHEASARLAAIGTESQAIAAVFATEQADLARLVSVVAAADHPISDLRRTVKMMGIVAINARVVAAGIVGDGDDFEVFTTDIAKLSESASRTIQEFSTVYRQLTDEVRRAAEQRAHFEAAHADTLSGLAASMDGSLEAVTRQRQASVDGSAETGRVSRQIGGRIASAVMALQVGDATRQRLEHVETALETLADLFDGKSVAGADLPAEEHDAALAAITGLQAAQLASAADAFTADVADAANALSDLATDARTIMVRSRDIYGHGKAGAQSPLAALSDQLRHAAEVLRDCETERGKLEIVAGAVQATVQSLLGHVEAVQEIEANMRLVSLNAAVKCAQLGPRGTALNVIASQLRELTGETVAAAETAMSGLHEAAGLAQSFGAAASGDAAGQVGQLEQEATAALGLLETVDQTLAEALGVLNLDGPKVVNLLGEAASSFADQSAISEAMADMHVLIAQYSADHIDPPSEALAAVLSVLRTKYTMDAERRIHEQLFGKDLTAPPPVVASETSAEADLDDLFF